MAKTLNLRIPEWHLNSLQKFLQLPFEFREEILEALENYRGELNQSSLKDYITDAFKSQNINKDDTYDFADVYLSLVMSLNEYSSNLDGFLAAIYNSYIDSFPEDVNKIEYKGLIYRLITGGKSSSDKARVIKLLAENQRNYLSSNIFQSLKTSFNEDGSVNGSAIVHNLKLNVIENGEDKEIFLSLDINDINQLAKQLKKAKDNHANIIKTFPEAKVIEI